MRKTKIICTIGPACEDMDSLRALFAAGMNVARLNQSHGDHEEHGRRIDRLQQLHKELNQPVGIMIDLKGPEIRTGSMENGNVTLEDGQPFVLTAETVAGTASRVSVSHTDLPGDVRPGSRILLDDGLIELVVNSVEGKDINCTVLNGGVLGSKKGINLPGVNVSLPALTEKDVDDITFGVSRGIDFVAASFVQRAEDVTNIRKLLVRLGGAGVQIISKIENQQGVSHIDEIIRVSDAIMVARGDLGVEIPIENVPIVQKDIIMKCNQAGKPVITATQMLDSMIRNPRPTRAEASDVANAILDGTDAIMLSGETAQGRYPVEAVRTMAKIAEHAEALPGKLMPTQHLYDMPTTDAVSFASCAMAERLDAAAIITATHSGGTARAISKFRPQCPIFATTVSEESSNKLSLVWGVIPLVIGTVENTDEIVDKSIAVVQARGALQCGDVAIITAGVPVGFSGTTNLIKVHVVGDVMLKGSGLGVKTVYGPVCVMMRAEDGEGIFPDGGILVTPMTDNSFLPYMRRAGALIVEGDDLLSHAGVVGLTLEIPVILGAMGAASLLKNGMFVSVEPTTGRVYNGKI